MSFGSPPPGRRSRGNSTHRQRLGRRTSSRHANAPTPEAVKRLEALREVERQRSELRSAAAWLRRLPDVGFDAATTRPPKPVADLTALENPRSAGEVMRATGLLDVLADYLQASSLAGEREQMARHEAEAKEKERRIAELQEVREANPPLAS
jgi:hypothetical protein